MDISSVTSSRIQPAVTTAAAEKENIRTTEQSTGNVDSIALGSAMPDKTFKLAAMNDDSNNLALLAKETDQKLSALANSVEKMKGVLEVIVKSYPPFSSESSERRELLMSYISIRKELLQLTFPPPPPPIYEKIQHQWQDLFQNDGKSSIIKLPEEPGVSAPDSDLAGMVSDLGTLHEGISSVRTNLKQTILTK